MYTATKVAPGLTLELAPRRATYRARACVQGRRGYFNTGAASLEEATTRALAWFATWRQDEAIEAGGHSMDRAAALVAQAYPARQADARKDFLKRWRAIRDVHGLGWMNVRQVDTKYLRAFAKVRGDIAASTAKKDFNTIGPILKAARAEGWLTALPEFPRVALTKNPRVPFTAAELRVLLDASTEPMVTDFLLIAVFGLLRPYEVWRLTVEDIADDGTRMWVRMRRKTGLAPAPVPMRFPRLRDAIRRRIQDVGSGCLFPVSAEWFPRRFSALLDVTGLRQPLGASYKPRDSASLRATGICLEIRRQRKKRGAADLLQIARWAGTSVSRIDGHYAAFLA